MKEKLIMWWNQRATREKQALSLGSALLLFVIVYQCVFSCLHSLEALRQRIALSQKTLLWMQTADKMMRAHSSSVKINPVSPVAFMSEMQKQVRLAGLEQSLLQLKQSDSVSIDLQFQKAEFDKLIRLLMSISKEYRVAITRFSVLATDVPGQVNASLAVRL